MQSIIVYRNPLEAAVWESLMNGNGLIIFLAVLALGVLWAVTWVLADKIKRAVSPKTYHYYGSQAVQSWTATLVTIGAIVALHFYNIG